jgi:putative aldouronate transport system permease protein
MKKPINGERVFYFANYCFITVITFSCFYPFLFILATSFSSLRAVNSGEVFIWPVEFTPLAYVQTIKYGQITRAMGNTVIITAVGSALSMFATILCSYGLSKKHLPGRGFFTGLIVFTMFFGGGMIPSFLLVRNLGLIDSYWALWLPGMISTFNMIVLRTFFQGIPDSLEEAAQIDGASAPYILFRIVLPLSGAALATITLFYAVDWWNTYMSALLYIPTTAKHPLMVRLQSLLTMAQMVSGGEGGRRTSRADEVQLAAETIKAATIVISVLPIMLVYPFLQKHFVKGVTIGSLKG